ncbi:MAG TPA: DNA topology modulation protein FlaR [Amycolatopsis sp.]|jgi:adenylate kinase family enzyme|nr:DNA topology modulation protein FlaR [Amycolatopsis sp.]
MQRRGQVDLRAAARFSPRPSVFHLDRHYWRPGWVPAPDDEFRATQCALVAGERWIIDGNYSSSLDLRLPAADTIVFFDFPRRRCLLRVAVRTARGWGRDGQAPGCFERIDLAFLRWMWHWHRDTRPRVLARLAEHGRGARQVLLSTPREVTGFLDAAREHAEAVDPGAAGANRAGGALT